MNITDSEYVELLEKIQGCKSLTDIEKVDKNKYPDVKQEYRFELQNIKSKQLNCQ